jgi:hypothetical protein
MGSAREVLQWRVLHGRFCAAVLHDENPAWKTLRAELREEPLAMDHAKNEPGRAEPNMKNPT